MNEKARTLTLPKQCSESGFRAQFACPHGWMGWVVGHLLALKNRERSLWVQGLLHLRPSDRVLEIGFGPGVDIRRASGTAAFVAGADISETMVRMAQRRNRAAVAQSRVELHQAGADDLPFESGAFDKVFCINVAKFWSKPAVAFQEVRRVLRPGGTLVIAEQPRSKGATEQTATESATLLERQFRAAGFESLRLERRAMRPVSTVCVLGVKGVRA